MHAHSRLSFLRPERAWRAGTRLAHPSPSGPMPLPLRGGALSLSLSNTLSLYTRDGGGGGAMGGSMDQMATFDKFTKRKQARTRAGKKKEKRDAFLVSENVLECNLSRNLLGNPSSDMSS